ncbi:MAG TPA: S1C family serine protease [Anaerolineaceae bacterium]|nr:S1C family serine protease [Anaerolineaceae bacterium]
MRRIQILLSLFVIASLTLACGFSIGGDEEPTPQPIPENTQNELPQAPAQTGMVNSLEAVQDATVQIEAQGSFVDPQLGSVYNAAGRGTGFIIDPSGIAVTNNHVVTGAALLKVWVPGESQPRNAKVLGVSECWDLAVIDIEGEGFSYLGYYEGNIDPGMEVYAAGFPLGDPEYTLTKGIISKAQAGGESSWASIDAVIEHDARIRGGNSGGPLITPEGKVVGVNYAGNDVFDQNFAIRVQDAIPVIERMRLGQDYESIGINGQSVVSEDGSISGIWVSSVKSGSPADKSGLQGGDILTTMEGLVLGLDGTMSDYCDILRSRNAQDTLAIEVLRFGTQEYLSGQLNGNKLETKFSFAQEFEGDVANQGGSYSEFVTVTDDYGAIQVSIPTAWNEVSGEPWYDGNDVIGSSIVAAANIDGFFNTYNEPGVFFGVSDDVARLAGYIQLLDVYRTSFVGDCTLDGRYPYDDSAFLGSYDVFINCGDSRSTIIVLAARPQVNQTSFLATVMVQILSDADLIALDEILSTFDVVGTLP